MKKIILLILFISSLSCSELNWSHDYQKALEKAKAEHKDIYIFIGADRCRFCDILKKEALVKNSVIKRLDKSYIYLYLSRDRDTIAKIFNKTGVPRHYFLDEDGEIFYEDVGFRNEAGFHQLLDDAEFVKETNKSYPD